MDRLVTLVTGARKGIGKFLAQRYLSRGHLVVGCSRQEAEWSNENYIHVQADVTDEQAMKQLFSLLRKQFGRLDHLINNAGIAAMNHSLLTPLSTLRKVLDVNVTGCFVCCREAAKMMKQRNFGRIVNFSTVAVPLALEGEAAYVASKGAVNSLTRVLAREFAAFGITVNIVGPAPVETDLIRSVPKRAIDQLIARQAIGRLGTLEDVGNVVDFFLREESNFVTGQTIYLGGVS